MSANSHKRTLRLSVLAPRVFVLAIQFATFRSCVWGAVWIKDHGLSYRFRGPADYIIAWRAAPSEFFNSLSQERTFRFNVAIHAVGCGNIAPPKAFMENLGVYKFTIS